MRTSDAEPSQGAERSNGLPSDRPASVLPAADRRADPRASYRLQLTPGRGFDHAADLCDYLAELGISHLYLSPVLQAAPGSEHGYDVIDHSRVSHELGGPEAHRRLCARAGELGLGQLLDIVPNHMAIGPANPWWWDVLENGPASKYADYFDVEWTSHEARLRDKVLLPILGDHSGRLVESREIHVTRDGGTFTIRYHEHAVPAGPRSMAEPLARAAARCGSEDLAFLADALEALPPPTELSAERLKRRHRDKEVLRRQLARLTAEEPEVARAVDEELAVTNNDPDLLDALLLRQNCRLAYWRVAASDLGYRRFFDINSLVGVRTEDPDVFAATHALVLHWLRDGVIDGVRVDHIDGPRDPTDYLRRLRSMAPQAWILVEKILEPGEPLRPAWPIDGTTGYDFMNEVGGLWIHPEAETPLTDLYASFTGEATSFEALVREKKRLVLRELLGSDLNRLTGLLLDVCERNRRFRDYSRNEIHEVLGEVLACFPVYRTYVEPEKPHVAPEDAHVISAAVADAKARRPDMDGELFDFLEHVLLLHINGELETELVARLQQTSGPVMAKGVEDTAFYCYNRFLTLNEVGGSPARFGTAIEEFHGCCRDRSYRHPRTLLATSTHDTKRSEDVRARLAVLSEIPADWAEAVARWSAHNERHRTNGQPDRNIEYAYYQTLVGAWPLDSRRAVTAMMKAAREAKQHTAWTRQDLAYEEALTAFVEQTLNDGEFLVDLEAFVDRIVAPGRVNSLAQTLLKLTAPGVPDLYQGTELWDLSLVDPDNRRPIDFDRRRRLLRVLRDATVEQVMQSFDEGLPKMWLICQALRLRRQDPEAMGPQGSYEPLLASGARADHVVGLIRGGRIAALAPRWTVLLGEDWAGTSIELPAGSWQNVLTADTVSGGRHEVAELLLRFPVTLLKREPL